MPIVRSPWPNIKKGNEAEKEALDQDGMSIYCDDVACSNTGDDPWGGTWCDFLGKSGCRACDVYKWVDRKCFAEHNAQTMSQGVSK